MYTNTKAVVLSPDGETDSFIIRAGVLQGDILAPYLFIIVLDYVMKVALGNDEANLGFTISQRRSRMQPAEVLTDLDFANDIALLSDTISHAQELLTRVEDAADTVGLTYDQAKYFQCLGSWVDALPGRHAIRCTLYINLISLPT